MPTSTNKNHFSASSHPYRLLVFWIGIIATIAYRAIIIIGRYSQSWVDITWYIGTIGFVWYFGHRYHIEKKRDQVIIKRDLIKKIKNSRPLDAEDTEALTYTLSSLISSKSRWNYIAIFIASGLALAYDLIIRFLS